MSTLVLAFFASLTVSLLLTPATRAVARRVGAVDRPDGQRKLQVQPVALGGGIAVYLAFGFALLLAGLMRPAGETVPARLTVVLALSTGLLGLVGLLDDTLDLRPRRKLLLQFLAAAPVVLAGFFPTQITFFGYVWSAGWWAAPVALLWLVACANALNLLDGLDGFASTAGIALAVMVAVLAIACGNLAVAVAGLALAGGARRISAVQLSARNNLPRRHGKSLDRACAGDPRTPYARRVWQVGPRDCAAGHHGDTAVGCADGHRTAAHAAAPIRRAGPQSPSPPLDRPRSFEWSGAGRACRALRGNLCGCVAGPVLAVGGGSMRRGRDASDGPGNDACLWAPRSGTDGHRVRRAFCQSGGVARPAATNALRDRSPVAGGDVVRGDLGKARRGGRRRGAANAGGELPSWRRNAGGPGFGAAAEEQPTAGGTRGDFRCKRRPRACR